MTTKIAANQKWLIFLRHHSAFMKYTLSSITFLSLTISSMALDDATISRNIVGTWKMLTDPSVLTIQSNGTYVETNTMDHLTVTGTWRVSSESLLVKPDGKPEASIVIVSIDDHKFVGQYGTNKNLVLVVGVKPTSSAADPNENKLIHVRYKELATTNNMFPDALDLKGPDVNFDQAIITSENALINGQFSGDDLKELYQNASSKRQQVIQALIKILNGPDRIFDYYQKCWAAAYLGKLRAAEAAGSLARHISMQFRSHSPGFDDEPISGTPAADALVEIGEPAIPYLIKNILESNDDMVVSFSMNAIAGIEGDDDIVQLRLKKALESQTDEKKKARVQWILNLLVSHTRWPLGSMPLVNKTELK